MWLLLLSLGLAPTQTGGESARPPAVLEERLSAWPTLDASGRRRISTALERLGAARTPEMESSARADLAELGDAAGPRLLDALGRSSDPQARARLASVLDELLSARHTRLLAAHFESKSHAQRCYALAKVGAHGDPQLREQAEAALARARARWEVAGGDGEAARKERELAHEERWSAALAATACRSTAGLDLLAEAAESQWNRVSGAVRAALSAGRNPELSAQLVDRVAASSGKARVAALWLLAAGAAGPQAIDCARAELDSGDTPTRLAAINALRALVDGAPAIDNLSVFESIELAKQWKERLR